MSKTAKVVLAVVVLALVVWGVSAAKHSKVDQSAKGPIKVGAVLSLTGDAAPWGEYGRDAINLAVKQINANGGIDGRQVEVVIEDDHTDGKQGVSAWNKLVSIDHVDGVIGGVFDFTAQPLMPLAENDKVAFISPSNFRIEGGFELNDESFVMMTDFNKVIRALKGYLSDQKITKLAVVHFKSTFGTEIAKTLDGVMKELGIPGIVEEEYTTIGGNDFKTMVAKLKADGVQAVFLDTLGSDSVNFVTRAKQAGFKPVFMSYNGLTDAFANEADKSLIENAVILNWEVSSPDFTKLYKDAYGVVPSKSADKFFDSVYVLAQAVADSATPADVASHIDGGTFTTPNGKVTFAKEHQVMNTPVEIDIVKSGVLVPYKQ